MLKQSSERHLIQLWVQQLVTINNEGRRWGHRRAVAFQNRRHSRDSRSQRYHPCNGLKIVVKGIRGVTQ
jgi:hypothetical protein